MRNLLEYPLEFNETISILESIRDDCLKDGLCGDMRPYILNKLIVYLKDSPQTINIFNEIFN